MRLALILLCLVAVGLSGCGTPGAPLPPSLQIPEPVSDLVAARKGDAVLLTWSVPSQTTDGELLKRPGKMIISRASGVDGTFQDIAELTLQPALAEKRQAKSSTTDSIRGLLQAGTSADFVVYRITSIGPSGKTAGPGNQVKVPALPTAPPPAKVELGLVPGGVTVSFVAPWPQAAPPRLSAQYAYKIMRRQEGAAEAAVVTRVRPGNEALVTVDTGIEWEKNYEYWVMPVTLWQNHGEKGEVEGDDSPVEKIFAHDTFAPATPGGLQAVYSGLAQSPFIDLTWTPNTEEDLAGYNLYRRTAEGDGAAPSGSAVKINSALVVSPAFKDADVKPGNRYFYSVAAVDLRGNESARSPETSEVVPKE